MKRSEGKVTSVELTMPEDIRADGSIQPRNTLTITLEDGRVFPVYEGKPTSWILDNSWEQKTLGYPKMRAVIRALLQHRRDTIMRERFDLLKASFDRTFGNAAAETLMVIDDEFAKASVTPYVPARKENPCEKST